MKLCKKTFTIFVIFALCLSCFFSCVQLPPADSSQSGSSESSSLQGGGEDASEIKNIVIIIGDGMGAQHITAGQLYIGELLSFVGWQSVRVNTDAVKKTGLGPVTTDSAAAATAMATGELTVNGYVGKSFTGNDLTTIMDDAVSLGKSTGIVTTDTLFGATPSGFSAHSLDRNLSEELVLSQLSSGVALLCGSTDELCTEKSAEITAAGYSYCDDFSLVEETMAAEKAYWQFDLAGVDATVELADASEKALNFLDRDGDGFVLMIEQAHIDKYSHNNDLSGAAESVRSLNDTVKAVLDWIGDREDTAVLVTADHETGGLTVSHKAGTYPKTLSTENGNIYYNWASSGHTNQNVMLYVYGIAVDFSKYDYYYSKHLIKNTDIYTLMKSLLLEYS